MDILSVGLFEENADLASAVVIKNRAFHGQNVFNIVLAYLFAGIENNKPHQDTESTGRKQTDCPQ